MNQLKEAPTLVLFVTSLLANHDHIVENKHRPAMSVSEIRTSTQVKYLSDIDLHHKVPLGCGQFLRVREMCI